jgi:aspartyl-tRNA(Asn)/glutamyl-tRNA(Gln) amidotransferase subunit B
VQAGLPELPHEKKRRYVGDYGLKPVDADTLVDEPGTAAFFEAVLDERVPPLDAAKLLLNAGAKRANERGCAIHELGITPRQVAQIAELSRADKIGSSAADELFGLCCEVANRDADAAVLAETHGLLQQSDTGALEQYVDEVLADPRNQKAVEDIREGKDKAIGALMGQIMKLSKGQANPKVVREIIVGKLRG